MSSQENKVQNPQDAAIGRKVEWFDLDCDVRDNNGEKDDLVEIKYLPDSSQVRSITGPTWPEGVTTATHSSSCSSHKLHGKKKDNKRTFPEMQGTSVA